MSNKKCFLCGKEFTSRGKQVFCSKECSEAYHRTLVESIKCKSCSDKDKCIYGSSYKGKNRPRKCPKKAAEKAAILNPS